MTPFATSGAVHYLQVWHMTVMHISIRLDTQQQLHTCCLGSWSSPILIDQHPVWPASIEPATNSPQLHHWWHCNQQKTSRV